MHEIGCNVRNHFRNYNLYKLRASWILDPEYLLSMYEHIYIAYRAANAARTGSPFTQVAQSKAFVAVAVLGGMRERREDQTSGVRRR